MTLWSRLPTIVRAVLAGGFAAAAGSLPWAALVKANTKYFTSVPWAVPITAVYLWLYWKYARGFWYPHSTSTARRVNSRTNRVPDEAWGTAIFAGVVGLVTVVLLQQILTRMVVLPHQQEPDISQVPFFTLLSWILMGAVVAGVAEEISFRGFMQRPIEQRYGPVTAILVTGVLFGFAHFGHPEVTLILMPYYVAVAAVYGLLAYFTDSIFPSMMLHAGGNMLGAFDLFTHGRSEWQTPAAPAPLIWDSGTDLSFWISCFFFLLAGVAATWAYINLARATRPLRLNLPDSPNLIITKK